MVKSKWGIAMLNMMEINGYKAVIAYDPEIELFRGEFVGLNGSADFYAKDIESLKKEGSISLQIFLDMCAEDGIEPRKEFSGRFNLRMPAKLHADLVGASAATGKSLNQWIVDTLNNIVHA